MDQAAVPLTEIDEQRQKVCQRIAALQAQLELLDSLAASAVAVNPVSHRTNGGKTGSISAKAAGAAASRANPFNRTTGANDEIRRIVSENPGLRPAAVVDRLIEAGVKTTSREPRRTFFSTIGTLTNREHLENRRGRLYPGRKLQERRRAEGAR